MSEYNCLQLIDIEFLLDCNSTYKPCTIDLYQTFPAVDSLLCLPVEELGAILLKELEIKHNQKNELNQNCRLSISLLKYYHPQLKEPNYVSQPLKERLEKHIWECWNFLKTKCYILPTGNGINISLSAEGKKIAEHCDPKSYIECNNYPWTILHPNINKVQKDFRHGEYGDAIASCFKEVEIYVKTIFSIKTSKLSGYNLMRHVFKNEDYKDYSDLFAGAFTLYRNPATHENINPNHSIAWHQIMLASLLLYELDKLNSKLNRIL
jgi:hypothetical protein